MGEWRWEETVAERLDDSDDEMSESLSFLAIPGISVTHDLMHDLGVVIKCKECGEGGWREWREWRGGGVEVLPESKSGVGFCPLVDGNNRKPSVPHTPTVTTSTSINDQCHLSWTCGLLDCCLWTLGLLLVDSCGFLGSRLGDGCDKRRACASTIVWIGDGAI